MGNDIVSVSTFSVCGACCELWVRCIFAAKVWATRIIIKGRKLQIANCKRQNPSPPSSYIARKAGVPPWIPFSRCVSSCSHPSHISYVARSLIAIPARRRPYTTRRLISPTLFYPTQLRKTQTQTHHQNTVPPPPCPSLYIHTTCRLFTRARTALPKHRRHYAQQLISL
jgi:hypothetical protein